MTRRKLRRKLFFNAVVIWRQYYKMALVVILAIGFIWFVAQLSVFAVKTIEVRNINSWENLSQPQVINQLAEEIEGENIFLLDIKQIAKEIKEKNDFISQVIIRKQLPNKVNIEIQEEEPVLKLEAKDVCHLLNFSGQKITELSFEKCEQFELPVVSAKENRQIYFNEVYASYILQWQNLLVNNFQTLPMAYEIESRPEVALRIIFEDYEVLLDVDQDVLYNYLNYRLVMEEVKKQKLVGKVLDLTYTDPIISKLDNN